MAEVSRNSKFLWLGNWPVVDFINTDIVLDGKPVDLLVGSDDVAAWLRESGLAEAFAFKGQRVPADLLEYARAYRTRLRRGIEDFVGRRAVAKTLLRETNVLLMRRVCVRQLMDDSEGCKQETKWSFREAADYLVPIAESLAKLLTEADPSRLRKCQNPECILYFYDTSKGGQRNWCSLDVCGNRLRMAAYRRKTALPRKGNLQ